MLASIASEESRHARFSYERPDRQEVSLRLRDSTEAPLQEHFEANNNPPYEYRRFEIFAFLQVLFSHRDQASSDREFIHPKPRMFMMAAHEANKM